MSYCKFALRFYLPRRVCGWCGKCDGSNRSWSTRRPRRRWREISHAEPQRKLPLQPGAERDSTKSIRYRATLPGETGSGLGPTFNGNSCAMCHAQPATGGSSPGLDEQAEPGAESAGRARHARRRVRTPFLPSSPQWAGAGSSLRYRAERSRRRRAWAVHHCRPS